MEGAIQSGDKENMREELNNTIAEAVAYLLFDDWSTIGDIQTGTQGIHVLSLDGLMIPLSYLLTATGEAMIETDAKSFHFNMNANGILKRPMKYEIKDFQQGGYILFEK